MKTRLKKQGFPLILALFTLILFNGPLLATPPNVITAHTVNLSQPANPDPSVAIPSIPPPAPAPPQLWNQTLGDPFQGFTPMSMSYRFNDIVYSGTDVFVVGTFGDYSSNVSRAYITSHSATTGAWNWKRYDVADQSFMTQGYSIATNGTTLFICGSFATALMPYTTGAFLGAYNTLNGGRLWYTTYNTSDREMAYNIAVNGSAVYITGTQYNSISMNDEAFLAKFNANTGIQLWNTTFATQGQTVGLNVAVNGSAVYIGGQNQSSGFIARFTASGSEVWNTSLGLYTMPLGLAANTSELYVSGYEYNPIGPANGTLWKIAANGAIQWKQNIVNTTLYDVAIDGAAIYLIGLQAIAVVYGPSMQVHSTLFRYDSIGTQIWNTTYDTPSPDFAMAITAYNNEIFFIGSYYTFIYPPVFGYSQTYTFAVDYFIAKHDQTGAFQWDHKEHAQGLEYASSIAIARNGLYITGAEKKNKQDVDIYLALYGFDGSLQWKKTLSSPLNEQGYALTVTRDHVYVTGIQYTEGLENLLLVCFDLQGNHLWNVTRNFSDMGYIFSFQSIFDLIETNNDIFIVGTLVNASMPMSMGDAGFLIGFDASNGAYLWNTTWATPPNNLQVGGIAGTVTNLYVTYTNFTDTALTCFDLTGTEQWKTRIIEVSGKPRVTVNASSLFVSGTIYNMSSGDYNAFLGAYDMAGIHQWNTSWSSVPLMMFPDQGNDVVVGTDTIYLIGATLDWNQYKGIAWIAGFDSMGIHQWNTTLNDQYYDTFFLVDVEAVEDTIFTAGMAQKANINYGHEIDAFIAAYGSGWNGLGDIYVYVEDALGNPVSGASVISTSQPSGQPALSGTTNASGYAEFIDIYAGAYTLEAASTGYLSDSSAVVLGPGETLVEPLTLQGIGTLTIYVENALGDPVSGALVTSTSQPSGQTALSDTTNTTGHVKFENILAGNYLFDVTASGYLSTTGESITMTAGETRAEIISLQGICTIEVLVTDATGNPVSGATVTSTLRPSGQTQLSGNTGLDGKITFSNVFTGTYSLQVTHPDFTPDSETFTVSVGEVKEITLTLGPLEGRGGIPPEWLLIAGVTVGVTIVIIVAGVIWYRRRAGSPK